MSHNEYQEKGGAIEKLDYLAKKISASSRNAACTENQCNVSISHKHKPDGKLYAAGFLVTVTS